MVVFEGGEQMSLLISGLTIKGYTYKEALYCKVRTPASTKEDEMLILFVYLNEEAKNTNPHAPFDILPFPINISNEQLFTCDALKAEGNEPFTASYNYLKTLYPDAITI